MGKLKKAEGDRAFVDRGSLKLRRKRAEPRLAWREKLERAIEAKLGVVLLSTDVRELVAEWNALCDAVNEKRPGKPKPPGA